MSTTDTGGGRAAHSPSVGGLKGARLLLLCQVLPHPPHSGAKLKTWNLVKWLGARCDVTLVAFSRGESAADIDALRRHCRAVHTVPMVRGMVRDAWSLATSVWSGRPWIIERDRRRAMHAMLRRLTREARFDVVHIDQLNMAQYAGYAAGAFTVLDAHNALWLLARRLADHSRRGVRKLLLARDSHRLRAYEGAIGRGVDAVLAVSDIDRRALADVMGSKCPIAVVPIAVDAEEVTPLRRRADTDRVVHIGTMFWPPNADAVRWFLEAVWPRIRAARPEARFDVIGPRPPRALRALATPANGVRFAGYLADPTGDLESAGAVVVPLLAGSGMRVKILTALAQALPVVTTTLGCEGIEVEAGRHLLIADGADAFAAATLRVLADRELADTLGRNGRRLVEQRYDYRHVLAALEPIYARGAAAAGDS